MSDWSATKAGLRLAVKSIAGVPYRRSISEMTTVSEDEFWHYQMKRFARIYSYARDKIPFYKVRSSDYPPINPKANDILDFLANLPIISK